MSTLRTVLERLRDGHQASGSRVVVFDIDSTLLSTHHRNLAILKEFARRPDLPPAFHDALQRLGQRDLGWNVMEDLRQSGFHDRPVLDQLKQFWFDRFFRDEYLHHDLPIPGAVEFVNEVHAAGAVVYYLTGRDAPNMGRGTRHSLLAHGFPLDGERVVLRLKPDFETPDLDFKRAVLGELQRDGEVTAVFENEPANANLFAEAFPAALVFFLETVHSPNPPPLLDGIFRIQNFLAEDEGSAATVGASRQGR